jgi:hypothetical protein
VSKFSPLPQLQIAPVHLVPLVLGLLLMEIVYHTPRVVINLLHLLYLLLRVLVWLVLQLLLPVLALLVPTVLSLQMVLLIVLRVLQ